MYVILKKFKSFYYYTFWCQNSKPRVSKIIDTSETFVHLNFLNNTKEKTKVNTSHNKKNVTYTFYLGPESLTADRYASLFPSNGSEEVPLSLVGLSKFK